MDYGGYIVIAILVVAIVFFILALLKHSQSAVLELTFYWCMILALVSLIIAMVSDSRDLMITAFIFMIIAVVFRWFYRGIQRDSKKS